MADRLDDWVGTDVYRQRHYNSYDAYVEHQAAKLRTINLDNYSKAFRPALTGRLQTARSLQARPRGASVLCLGARNGVECQAFIDLGYFAVGLDLNPGLVNRHVVVGDFHSLQFASESVDIVYTNVLDHAFDIEMVFREIHRVLKSDGIVIAEIVRGSKDENGREPGDYECVWWDRSEEVVRRFLHCGFEIDQTTPFDYPWVGDQIVLFKTATGHVASET